MTGKKWVAVRSGKLFNNELLSEFDFLLQDRIEKIKQINEMLDLEHNAHISFSGGKDSTVLHYLIDLALPNNHIPRVFANTGIEYLEIVKYVKNLAKKDDRFVILKQNKNIPLTLKKYGYPFKSKLHSQKVMKAQNLIRKGKELSPFLAEYINVDDKSYRKCPKSLIYQFKEVSPFKISDKYCTMLKKDLFHNFEKSSGRCITITGMRSDEGGAREKLTCLSSNNTKFHPLIVIDDEWEEWFIKEYEIKLCKLYYPPYNFTRTGCKGCPFSLDLQKNLETLYKLLPNEYKQCVSLWKPVYDEYIRIGYRLKSYPCNVQYNIFDIIEELNRK